MGRLGCVTLLLATGCLMWARQTDIEREHIRWILSVMESIQSIKPGMTRQELLEVFTTEGGLSTRLQRTYVHKQCPYIKVTVEFEAAGNPESGAEIPQDRILKISTPFLEYSHFD